MNRLELRLVVECETVVDIILRHCVSRIFSTHNYIIHECRILSELKEKKKKKGNIEKRISISHFKNLLNDIFDDR